MVESEFDWEESRLWFNFEDMLIFFQNDLYGNELREIFK